MKVVSISPQQLFEQIQRDSSLDLIDVRTPAEFSAMHVAAARNVPLDVLDPNSLPRANGKSLYVICQTGSRARQACEKLGASGFDNVASVEGGTRAWASAGLPLVYGRAVVSLERQVRIAAGSLVLLGILLGVFVHPGLLGLSAFVGAGLVFAGVTDTCGMAMLLAKLPWNRRPPHR